MGIGEDGIQPGREVSQMVALVVGVKLGRAASTQSGLETIVGDEALPGVSHDGELEEGIKVGRRQFLPIPGDVFVVLPAIAERAGQAASAGFRNVDEDEASFVADHENYRARLTACLPGFRRISRSREARTCRCSGSRIIGGPSFCSSTRSSREIPTRSSSTRTIGRADLSGSSRIHSRDSRAPAQGR